MNVLIIYRISVSCYRKKVLCDQFRWSLYPNSW